MSYIRPVLLMFLLLVLPLTVQAQEKLKVVASFSIIGNMVNEIAGSNVELHVLVGANGNVHEYEPTTGDAKTVANANLVFINGLGLEGWMERLLKSSDYHGTIITLTQNITPLLLSGHPDPHAWQSIENGKIYVTNIRAALIKADPSHRIQYEANTTAYLKKLDVLDAWIKKQLFAVPADKRKVISMHDSFQYFARSYGIEFIAPLGISTESQASASDLAHIIDQVRQHHITAVFLENMTDSRLIRQLQSDAGAHIGGTLYSDALSPPGGPATDYIMMFRHNVSELVAAMQANNAPATH